MNSRDDERCEILLPHGTKYVTVEDIPRLIAGALHPDSGDRDEMTISYLLKTRYPCGHRSNPGDLSDLGARLSPDDWDYLNGVWSSIAPYKDGITATSWQQYAAAFDAAPDKPSWHLTPVWVNPGASNPLSRANAEEQHKHHLSKVIHAGALKTFDSAMVPLDPNQGTAPFARILIDDFSRYAESSLRLHVRVQEMSDIAAVPSTRHEMDWIRGARAMGQEIHKGSPKLSIDEISRRVQPKLRAAGILGRGGKTLSASSIKRHALKGIKK